MAKLKNTVTFTLNNSLQKEITERANTEFTRAQHQWGVNIEEKRAEIINIATEQLVEKVNSMGGVNWFEFTNKIELVIDKAPWVGTIPLPLTETDEVLYGHIHIERPRNTWTYVKEPSENSIPLERLPEDFYHKVLELIETAVFYGVGSYKGGI